MKPTPAPTDFAKAIDGWCGDTIAMAIADRFPAEQQDLAFDIAHRMLLEAAPAIEVAVRAMVELHAATGRGTTRE